MPRGGRRARGSRADERSGGGAAAAAGLLGELAAEFGVGEDVEGIGDRAVWLPNAGVGTLWARAGQAAVGATVAREDEVGDREAARAVAAAALATVRAGGRATPVATASG